MHALISFSVGPQILATTAIHTFDWQSPVTAMHSFVATIVHLFDWQFPIG